MPFPVRSYACDMNSVTIRSGRVIVCRMFDVAEEIDLAAVERIVREGTARLSIARGGAHAPIFRDAPVSITLATSQIRLGASRVAAETYVRLWNYGAISLQFHVPIRPGTTWDELIALAAVVEDDNDVDRVARLKAADVRATMTAALKLPHEPAAAEDYVVYVISSLEGASASDLEDRVDIPALILGEPHVKLSARTRQSILENTFAYTEDELVVVDWNSALVVDPTGSGDVADVVEFAVTHLMELRYFDDILDQRMEKVYDEVEKRRPRLLGRDYESLSREASSLFLEFSDYVERVENSVKFVGDPYLATIFRAAAARFNLREWEESVTRKLNGLARISELLQAEVNVRRSHFLEIIIIVLILYEIVSTALKLG